MTLITFFLSGGMITGAENCGPFINFTRFCFFISRSEVSRMISLSVLQAVLFHIFLKIKFEEEMSCSLTPQTKNKCLFLKK